MKKKFRYYNIIKAKTNRAEVIVCFFLVLISVAFSLGSCKKLIETDAPINQLVTTNVFSDNSTAIATQLGVYTQMVGDPATLDIFTAFSSDEVISTVAGSPYRGLYTNSLNATTDASGISWSRYYNYIYEENAIIENVAASKKLSGIVAKQLTGEALFTRAYWYFNLVNLYGDVPLILTTDYTKNSTVSRTSSDLVYQQVIGDLTTAQGLLSKNYLDATDTTVTNDRLRPTTWAASALLARVLLYKNRWAEAETQASIVIQNTSLFSLPADPNVVFRANSSEAIWQIFPTGANGAITSEAGDFVLTTKPSTSFNRSSTISTQLLNAFELGDKRKSSWVGTITVSGLTYNFASKYKNAIAPQPSNTEYSMVLRLAEQYLIRAEARAHQGNLNGAIADLNVIRNRAGLGSLSNSLTQDQVLAAVMQERRVELFTEAHRWFDLKRTGTIDAVMGNPGNATQAKGGAGWQPYQRFYPISLTDIANDPNLTQTPGYF